MQIEEKRLTEILKKSVVEKIEEINVDATKINLQEFAILIYFLAVKGYEFEKLENGRAIFIKKIRNIEF